MEQFSLLNVTCTVTATSKVELFAVFFFWENPDPESSEPEVLNKILEWLPLVVFFILLAGS